MGIVVKHKVGGSGAWPAAPAEIPRKASWLLGVCLLAVLQTAGCASQPPVSDAARRPLRVITDFRTIETPEAVAVIVKSDQPLTYTAILQEDPRGVLFQFPETALEGLDAVYFPPPNSVIRSIRTAEAAGGSEAHVFLELAQETFYEVLPDKEGLKIVFRKASAETAFGGMPAISGTVASPPKLPAAALKSEPPPAKMAAATPAPVASVLREVRTEVRADSVLIRLTADGTLKTANVFTLENPVRIVFDFMGLQSTFKGEQRIPVRSELVSQVRHLGYPDKVRLVVDTEARHLKSYAMEPAADGLVITVGAKKQ